MSILVDDKTPVMIQGITSTTGQLFVERMLKWGSPIVGGVTPGKGGQRVAGLPVFNAVEEAVAHTGARIVLSCVPPYAVIDGVFETVDAGIELVVLYIENIPVHDALRMCRYAEYRGTRILGPNSAGVVSPGVSNISDLNDSNISPGTVGIVSKSGTLTYEVIEELHAQGLGQSTIVCLGGDRVIGTGYAEILHLFEHDPDTDIVVLIGEPGGAMEYGAAREIASMDTPVVSLVVGQASPAETRMGHAGAVAGLDEKSQPRNKMAALASAGSIVAERVTDIGKLVSETI